VESNLINIIFYFFIFAVFIYFTAKKKLNQYFLLTIFLHYLLPPFLFFKVGSLELKHSQIVILIFIITFAITNKYYEKSLFDKKILIPIIFIIILRLFSTAFSSDIFITLRYVIITSFTWYFFYFVVVKIIKTENDIDNLIKTIFITAFIVSILNYIEYAVGGINFTLSENYYYYERYNILRVYGIFGDPVVTSFFLLPVCPWGFYLYKKENKWKWIILTVVLIGGMFLNFTRVTIIALFLIIVLIFFISRKFSLKIIFSTILITPFLVTNNPFTQAIYDLFYSSSQQGNFEYSRTFGIIDNFYEIISKIPFWGLGSGTLIRADLMNDYFNKLGYLISDTSIRTEIPFFLHMAIDSGVISVVAMLFLFFYSIFKSLKLIFINKIPLLSIELYLALSFIGFFIILSSNAVYNSFGLYFIFLGILNVRINYFNKNSLS